MSLKDARVFNPSELKKFIQKGTDCVHLDLSGNLLEHIPEIVFSLTNLVSLDLSRNRIKDVSGLSSLINLETLILDVNQISKFDLDLPNLSRLSLSRNRLKKSIPFNGTFLNLSHNEIKTIDYEINVIELILSHNKLNNRILSDMDKLNAEILDISFNNITNTLRFKSNIRELDISYNDVGEIKLETPNLVKLEANGCDLDEIDLLKLAKLEILHLDNNVFESIPKLPLTLIELVMSNNLLSCLNTNLFTAKMLIKLDCSCNEIDVINKKIEELEYLEDLILSKNKIKVIPKQVYESRSIIVLDLSYNEITALNPGKCLRLDNLTKFNMVGNPLKVIAKEITDMKLFDLYVSDGKFGGTKVEEGTTIYIYHLNNYIDVSDNLEFTDVSEITENAKKKLVF